MENRKKVLVVGAAGFIGKHLVDAFDKAGFIVFPFSRSMGCDIFKNESLDRFIDKKIDIVLYAAGKTFVPDSWKHADLFYAINTLGTQRVLDFCRRTKALMVYISGYIYGVPQYLPIDEKHPVRPNNPYAHSKWLGEEQCRFYNQEMGVKTLILRPFNIYGPGQRDVFLIPQLLQQSEKSGEIVVKDETPRRDYLYISDFIEACILAMSYKGDFGIFNVGYGASFSVREIIETIVSCYEKKIPWSSIGQERKNEIPETVADCSLIKDVFGWAPKVSLEEGIRRNLYIYHRRAA